MPIIEWNAGFLLGNKEIDQHREHLVELLNKAYDEFRGGTNIGQSVVEELIEYATNDFAREEGWMSKISYPHSSEHAEEHEIFVCRVLEFKKSLNNNGNITVEILWFLCNWVTHHIRETDAKLGRFVDVQNLHSRLNRKIT